MRTARFGSDARPVATNAIDLVGREWWPAAAECQESEDPVRTGTCESPLPGRPIDSGGRLLTTVQVRSDEKACHEFRPRRDGEDSIDPFDVLVDGVAGDAHLGGDFLFTAAGKQ